MQPLQRILSEFGARMGSLPANSKLLLGALTLIVLLGTLLILQFTGGRDMLPLGLTAASTDVRAEAVTFLDSVQVPYEDRGNDIYVPAEQRLSVLGRLNEQKIVAVDEINFNSLVDLGSNPFSSQHHQRQMLLIAKMNAVKGMIAVRRDVGFVDIVIDEKNGLPGIGQARIPAVAIVSVQMRGEPMTQEFADAVGHMVAGAQSGLQLDDVTVVDLTSMRTFKPRSHTSPAATGYLEQQARIEEHYRKRFEPMLAHIPGAVVTVTAVVRNTRMTTRATTIDDPKIAPVSSETRDYEVGAGGSGRGIAAGSNVGSNVAARISGNGRSQQAVESMTREERESRFGGSEIVVEDDTGYALQVNAVVGVPRSFLLELFDEEVRAGSLSASADPAVFQAFAQEQTARLESDLAPLIRTDPLDDAVPGEINVWMLPDIHSASAALDAAREDSASTAMAGVGGGDSSTFRTVGLAALGLVGLATMLLVVRRAGTRIEPRTEDNLMPPFSTHADPRPVTAASNDPRFGGDGIDDATARTQQLLTQINQLVSGGTDDAADVIERWLSANNG